MSEEGYKKEVTGIMGLYSMDLIWLLILLLNVIEHIPFFHMSDIVWPRASSLKQYYY